MIIKDKWKYHVALGILVLFLSYLTDYGAGGKALLMSNFSGTRLELLGTFYLTSIVVYFVNFSLVSPYLLTKKKNIAFFLLAIIGLSISFALLRYILEEVILFEITGIHNYQGKSLTTKYYLFDNFHFAIKPILYSTIMYLVFRFIETKDEINQMKLEQKNAKYDFLKSQISPHFLFNTLNVFYTELILTQPETAKGIYKLSELLRYVTYESKNDFVLLTSEIQFIHDYIYFYKKRYEKELQVQFEIIGEVEFQKVPSLILIHFIENLFKHGIVNDNNYSALIQIKIENDKLEMITKNRIQTSEKYTDSGIGKENVRRRLISLYENDFVVEYTTEDDIFVSKLIMPLQ